MLAGATFGIGYLVGNYDEPISVPVTAEPAQVLGVQINRAEQGASTTVVPSTAVPTTVPSTTTSTLPIQERIARSDELRRQARERCLQLFPNPRAQQRC